MRHLSIVVTAICLGVVTMATCVPAPEPVGEEAPGTDADVDAINAAYDQSLATQKEGDVDAWLALFTEDVVFMPPNQIVVVGKEAVRAVVQPFLEQFTLEESISLDELEVSSDWAFARGTRQFRVTPKAGGDTLEQSVKFIHILRRQSDGTWKFSRWIWNGDSPAE